MSGLLPVGRNGGEMIRHRKGIVVQYYYINPEGEGML